ncbi:2OG-Fe(II) oxygenase superfamily protein [Austwickia chelonae]|uniref:2OG-Fe(II) oxygenase n=1 Tax=Austwickia chelonae TaxID=100225 RepID=UPI00030A9A4F|nr:2OG-Fe(II) oxygenase [Austwickia chelonae]SEW35037.1 2OG-Fe(II) oxygenase superfamily protein [Austwickia chelonae]
MTEITGAGYNIQLPDETACAHWRESFLSADPWPHLVLDDLVPRELALEAYAQECRRIHRLTRLAGRGSRKSSATAGFGPAAAQILQALDSPAMVSFLEGLTGIPELEHDPGRTWAGLHVNLPGDYHWLHRDFIRHPTDGRWHRVTVIVYLNPSWPTDYGGQLELWGPSSDTPAAVVPPVAPTAVVFENSSDAIHGLPEPITCPDGLARLSLTAYYYTREAPPRRDRYHPLIRRPRRPQDPFRQGHAPLSEIVEGLDLRAKDLTHALHRRRCAPEP